ncbi:outer membrane porin, OprD family protein [Izhakiella australiensis]|uniref:Outer membrane porin, OprD family protein n=1 Tax=Izhakiella australiensis TaxID=1926881 RepID=A0A1S8YA01_9GAMM|nr:OprD family outer membrane porin [Izhakiella australiensis]OON35676.1 outer membrane porin, OprD family protein [Izhakiella australiensis]
MKIKNIGLPLALLSGCSFAACGAVALPFNSDGLLEDSKLDIRLKNVWMLNGTDGLSQIGMGDQAAWAQAVLVDYDSGWWRDTLGFGVSWYDVEKLYANNSFAPRDLVRDNNGHAEGFNKFGQFYAKARWGNKQRYAHVNLGWKQLYKFGILNVTRSRAAPSSWEGVSLVSGWDQFVFRAAVVNRFSERDEPEMRHFYTLSSHKKIPYIATSDISWRPSKGNSLTYVVGESKDYIMRHGVEAEGRLAVSTDSDLLFRGVYYYNKGLGEWEGTRGFSHSAQHIYGLVGYRYKNVESGLGWSKTKADLDDGLGRFYWHLGRNTRGAFNSKADGPGNDYINNGEQMLYLYSQYAFSEEFSVGTYGYYGWDVKYHGVSLKEWEYGGYFRWTPKQIKGFSFAAAFGPAYSWKLDKGNPWLTGDKNGYHRSQGIGGGVTVEYRFGIL